MREITRVSKPIPELRQELAERSMMPLVRCYRPNGPLPRNNTFADRYRISMALSAGVEYRDEMEQKIKATYEGEVAKHQDFDPKEVVLSHGALDVHSLDWFLTIPKPKLEQLVQERRRAYEAINIVSFSMMESERVFKVVEGRHRIVAAVYKGLDKVSGVLVHQIPLMEGSVFAIGSTYSMNQQMPNKHRDYHNYERKFYGSEIRAFGDKADFYNHVPIIWGLNGDTLTALQVSIFHSIKNNRRKLLIPDILIARGAAAVLVAE